MGARKHLNFSKYFEMRRLFLLAFVLRGYNLDTSGDCSEVKNVTCDTEGNAVLDTAALYKYDRCEWSFKEKDGTTREVLTPSQNITVSCIMAEYRINVHCSDPKRVFPTCFNMVNETNQIVKHNIGADNHGSHKIMGICFGVLVLFLVSCAGLFCWKKYKSGITDMASSKGSPQGII